MYRVLFAMYRKPDQSLEEFLAHYRDVHIPITSRFPGVGQYDVYPVSGGQEGDGPDAFAVMAFDSPEDFDAVLSSDVFKEAMADSETFVARADSYVVDHIPVVGTAADAG
jgi:uncharacterized protein (TIGR02118 family)